MPSMIANGIAWLNAQLGTHESGTVQYRRGIYTVDFVATIGRTVFRQSDKVDGGTRLEFGERDYLIEAALLILNGSLTAPLQGDVIAYTEGGVVKLYKSLAPGGEPAWRWSDAHKLRYRIHTKHTGNE